MNWLRASDICSGVEVFRTYPHAPVRSTSSTVLRSFLTDSTAQRVRRSFFSDPPDDFCHRKVRQTKVQKRDRRLQAFDLMERPFGRADLRYNSEAAESIAESRKTFAHQRQFVGE